jgi:hypothetical protein
MTRAWYDPHDCTVGPPGGPALQRRLPGCWWYFMEQSDAGRTRRPQLSRWRRHPSLAAPRCAGNLGTQVKKISNLKSLVKVCTANGGLPLRVTGGLSAQGSLNGRGACVFGCTFCDKSQDAQPTRHAQLGCDTLLCKADPAAPAPDPTPIKFVPHFRPSARRRGGHSELWRCYGHL